MSAGCHAEVLRVTTGRELPSAPGRSASAATRATATEATSSRHRGPRRCPTQYLRVNAGGATVAAARFLASVGARRIVSSAIATSRWRRTEERGLDGIGAAAHVLVYCR
ncbi:MAG: hypothetical protein ACYCV7_02050 [Acidimicrobiales bacterium]